MHRCIPFVSSVINLLLYWGNRVGRHGVDTSGLGQGSVVDSCEHGNEPLGSIKGGEYLA
jgi:hypothetical protein